MRTITLSVDDETYRRSHIRAAELGTSVSALVRDYLGTLATASAGSSSAKTSLERRRHLLREVTEDFERRGVGLEMAGSLPRSELYDRCWARAEVAMAGREKPAGSAPKPDPPRGRQVRQTDPPRS